jgi:hypothetical protein
MSIPEIGCCCAYCRTCRAFRAGQCKGCKLGYDDGSRDIRRAKCTMKVCCMTQKQLPTCADCPDFDSCTVLQSWYGKAAGKYRRYAASAHYIREHGYRSFMKIADKWKDACGQLK